MERPINKTRGLSQFWLILALRLRKVISLELTKSENSTSSKYL